MDKFPIALSHDWAINIIERNTTTALNIIVIVDFMLTLLIRVTHWVLTIMLSSEY